MPLTRIVPTGIDSTSTFTMFAARFTATVNASSTVTGAVVLTGGLGVGQDIHFGGNLYQNGVLFTGGGGGGSSTSSDYAVTATNIEGGSNGDIPYQYGAGLTSFITTGSQYSVLQSNWPFAPNWTNSLWLQSDNAAFSTQTGALIVTGGVGIGQDLYVGGDIIAKKLVIDLTTITTTMVETDDIIETSNTTNASSTITGALIVAGGVGVGQNLYVGGSLNVTGSISGSISGNAATVSTIRQSSANTYYLTFVDSNNSGAQAESLYTSATIYFSPSYGMTLTQSLTVGGSTNATSTATGAFQTAGGVGVGKDLWVNGQVNIINGTESTTTGTGALIVTGGIGIGKNIVSRGSMFIGTGTISVGTAGEIRASNEITAYFGSDINLKENLQLITDPLDKLSMINGYKFDWKDDYIAARGGEDGFYVRKKDIGVIAQEIEKILPEIVGTRPDGNKAVRYEKIIALLIEAVKEQQKFITQILDVLNKHNIK